METASVVCSSVTGSEDTAELSFVSNEFVTKKERRLNWDLKILAKLATLPSYTCRFNPRRPPAYRLTVNDVFKLALSQGFAVFQCQNCAKSLLITFTSGETKKNISNEVELGQQAIIYLGDSLKVQIH